MKPATRNLLIIVGVVGLALYFGFAAGLTISGKQAITLLMVFFAIGIILFYLWFRHGKHRDDFEEARNYAIARWKEINKEEFSREDWEGRQANFGPTERAYVFVCKRALSIKGGMPGLIAVRPDGRGYTIIWMKDKLTSAEERNPVEALELYLHATPVPTKEFYPKAIEVIGPGGRKGRRGITMNIGSAVGGSTEPPKQEDEGQ